MNTFDTECVTGNPQWRCRSIILFSEKKSIVQFTTVCYCFMVSSSKAYPVLLNLASRDKKKKRKKQRYDIFFIYFIYSVCIQINSSFVPWSYVYGKFSFIRHCRAYPVLMPVHFCVMSKFVVGSVFGFRGLFLAQSSVYFPRVTLTSIGAYLTCAQL